MKFRPSFFHAVQFYSPEERRIQRRHAPVAILLWLLTLASALLAVWWLTVSSAALFCAYVVWSARRRRYLLTELKRKEPRNDSLP
jgi:hypothetical protein